MAECPAAGGDARENKRRRVEQEEAFERIWNEDLAARDPSSFIQTLIPILGTDREADAIARLRGDAEELRKQKKRISQQIRNEKRKRSRLLKKSAGLTNKELVKIMHVRGLRAQANPARSSAAPAPTDVTVAVGPTEAPAATPLSRPEAFPEFPE